MKKPSDLRSLPLFEWQPPVTILAFPLSKRTSKVRRVAEVMSRQKTAKAEDAYFKNIDEGLKANLLKSGVRASKINSELDTFWSEVALEMDRQS